MSGRPPTQLDLYIEWFKNNQVFSIVLLVAAITIGLGNVTGALSKITAFFGTVFSSDDFAEMLSDAKKAYADQNFEVAVERFEDLGSKAKDDPSHGEEFDDLRNASLASKLLVKAIAKQQSFEIEKDPDKRERLEVESANAWDRANRIYPYGMKHEVLSPTN